PGIKLDLFGEHDLHMAVDCQAGLARLAHPQQFGLSSGFATNETCNLETRLHLSPRDKLHFRGGATYSQDPFSIGLGLLLRAGALAPRTARRAASSTKATRSCSGTPTRSVPGRT